MGHTSLLRSSVAFSLHANLGLLLVSRKGGSQQSVLVNNPDSGSWRQLTLHDVFPMAQPKTGRKQLCVRLCPMQENGMEGKNHLRGCSAHQVEPSKWRSGALAGRSRKPWEAQQDKNIGMFTYSQPT